MCFRDDRKDGLWLRRWAVIQRSGFSSHFCHRLPVWPWVSHLILLCPNFQSVKWDDDNTVDSLGNILLHRMLSRKGLVGAIVTPIIKMIPVLLGFILS